MKKIKTVLILSANPQDTARLRLDEEVREIREGLKRSKYREQFIIQQAWAVRLRDLRRVLLDYEPQIVHFCGHGEASGIMVEDDQGHAIAVDPNALAGLFKLFDQIECVLLNACYSEPQADAINEHITYVIGMRQSITDRAGIEFAVGFYDALGAGKTFEKAFEFGCNAIELYKIPQSSIPVLKKAQGLQEIQDNLSNKPIRAQSQDATPHDSRGSEESIIKRFSAFSNDVNTLYDSILKEPPQRISTILSQANIYFDPCYDLEYYYPKLDILVLLFDHVLLHSPQRWHFLTEEKKDVYQTAYSSERFLQFVERGFVIPCTVVSPNEIWNPKSEGEFGRRILNSNNYIFKQEMADVDLYESLRSKFDQLDNVNPEVYDILSNNGWDYCYLDRQVLQRHNRDPDFGMKRFIHEINGDLLFTKLINTPELLKPSFLPIWRHKLNEFANLCYSSNRVNANAPSVDTFTEIMSKESAISALVDFIRTKNLTIPKYLSVKQIESFRKEGATESFRKFLRKAYEHSQEVKELPLDTTLVDDFNSLWSGYTKKRNTLTITLQSFIGSTLIGYATHINPALGAGVAAGVAGTWGMVSKVMESSINEISKKFAVSSWMMYLLKTQG